MVIKTKIGKSFGGCVRYNLEREQVEVIHAEGVRMDTAQHMTEDFNQLRKQNPELGKAVWHTSISFAPEDKVSPELIKNITQDYIAKFKLEQYAVIQHHDQGQTHFHIIGNRVNYEGKTISDQYCYKRGIELSQRLEKKYELTQTKTVGKRLELTHQDKLHGHDKTKYEIYEAVQKELPKCKNLEELQAKIKPHGIEMEIKLNNKKQAFGVSFKKGKECFKGSAVDKTLGINQLNKTIEKTLENTLKQAVKNVVPGLSQVSQVIKITKSLGKGIAHEPEL